MASHNFSTLLSMYVANPLLWAGCNQGHFFFFFFFLSWVLLVWIQYLNLSKFIVVVFCFAIHSDISLYSIVLCYSQELLYSLFFFNCFPTSCWIKFKDPSLPFYLPIVVISEMQAAASNTRTSFTKTIFYNDNYWHTYTSKKR